MFEHYRQKRAAKRREREHARAAKVYQHDLAAWEAQHDAYTSLVGLAQNFAGEPSTEIMLKPGETVFAKVTGASLIEDRKGPGRWQGSSQGVSIPIGSIGGHAVRYHVGATRGHYVQGTPSPTAVDSGTVFVTNKRVVFEGARQTRECLFDKLIGYQHSPAGETTFSVSNRQKPTTIHYGTNVAGWFDFRLDLALAHYHNTVPALVAQLQQELSAIDAHKPVLADSPAPAP